MSFELIPGNLQKNASITPSTPVHVTIILHIEFSDD